MLQWLQRFMAGRHGPDQLTAALLVVSVLISVTAQLGRWRWLLLASYLILALALYRMLSKNHNRRFLENQKFLSVWRRITGWWHRQDERMRERRTHRFYQCPQCGQTLRVPKGKGRITITCPKCHHEFSKKT